MKTVLITGISRGIGKALAEKFLNSEYFVIGTSTIGMCKLKSENLKTFSLDLSNSKSITSFANDLKTFGKKVDILINNAGIWAGIEDDVVRMDNIRKVLEVNLIGTIDFTEQVLAFLNQDAHIINISSRAGSLGYANHPNYPEYKISKAGLNMYTRILSFRLKDQAIVSSVHPGWVKTDMGGTDADMTPEEAAEHIFKLAISRPETGQFWFKGEKFPW